MHNNNQLLNVAIEITKEYARGGGPLHPEGVLERVFRKLQELNKETQ